ncbi:hypothetical protein CTAYLR_000052 [Chrysophaeum taylorii]|uniref:HECT-type E3 ubiquitin transferase n=1 Tax=Chrysophaeum taylorii TaxID=2483200 RepID=A0AAD7XN77_9STRA|nr:hypothetical protein CTAYLR_000052 [Chrysophaeum taylorii]
MGLCNSVRRGDVVKAAAAAAPRGGEEKEQQQQQQQQRAEDVKEEDLPASASLDAVLDKAKRMKLLRNKEMVMRQVESGVVSPKSAAMHWDRAVREFDEAITSTAHHDELVEAMEEAELSPVRCRQLSYVRRLNTALSMVEFRATNNFEDPMMMSSTERSATPPEGFAGWVSYVVVECGERGLILNKTASKDPVEPNVCFAAGDRLFGLDDEETDATALYKSGKVFLEVTDGAQRGFVRRVRRVWDYDGAKPSKGEDDDDVKCRFLVVPEASAAQMRVLAPAPEPFEIKAARLESMVRSLRYPWEAGQTLVVVTRKGMGRALLDQTSGLSTRDFRQTWRFGIVGEHARDDGGVTREVWNLAIAEIFSPSFGLWRYAATDNVTVQIRPDAEDNQKYYGVGRLVGKALLDKQPISALLSRPMLKHILGLPVTFSDLEFVDAALHHSCKYLLDNEGADNLCLMFDHRDRDSKQTHELGKGGRSRPVTDENKDEFVARLFKYAMMDQIAKPLAAFLRGIYEILPLEILSNAGLAAGDLELLISGLDRIDIRDWKKHTTLSGGLYRSAPVVAYFWSYVSDLSDARRAKLLQFVTGTTRLPPGGFRDLQGRDGEPKRFELRGKHQPPPCAHTCFNTLDLPKYTSKAALADAFDTILDADVAFFSCV